VRTDRRGHPGTDPAHALETGERAERSERFAVGDDPPRERRPDARQPLDLRRRSDIEVDDE
jgi:hypothetical protein